MKLCITIELKTKIKGDLKVNDEVIIRLMGKAIQQYLLFLSEHRHHMGV